MADWTRGIKKEDVPVQYHAMIDAIGLIAFLEMIKTHGGTYYYVPKADQVLRKIRDDRIRAEFQGDNYKELAVKYDLSEIQIRRIVEGNNPQLPGQLDMLGMLPQARTG